MATLPDGFRWLNNRGESHETSQDQASAIGNGGFRRWCLGVPRVVTGVGYIGVRSQRAGAGRAAADPRERRWRGTTDNPPRSGGRSSCRCGLWRLRPRACERRLCLPLNCNATRRQASLA
jgi:hypothetical protein